MNAMSSSLLARDFIENGYDPYRIMNKRPQRPLTSVPIGLPADLMSASDMSPSSSSCFSQPNVTAFSSIAPNMLLKRTTGSETTLPWLLPNNGFPSIPKISSGLRLNSVGSTDELVPKVEPLVKNDVPAQQSQLISFLAGQNASLKSMLHANNNHRNSTTAPGLLPQTYYSDPRSCGDGSSNNNNLKQFTDFSRYIAQQQHRQGIASVGDGGGQFGSNNSPIYWNSLNNQPVGNPGRYGYSQCSNSRHMPLSIGPSSLSFDAASDVDFLNMLADVDKQFNLQSTNSLTHKSQQSNYASACCYSINRDELNEQHLTGGTFNNDRKSTEGNVTNTKSQKKGNSNQNLNDYSCKIMQPIMSPRSKDWIDGISQLKESIKSRADLNHKPLDLLASVKECQNYIDSLQPNPPNLVAECDQPHRSNQSAETTCASEPCSEMFSKPLINKKPANRKKRKPKQAGARNWATDHSKPKRTPNQASDNLGEGGGTTAEAIYISSKQLPSRRGQGILDSL